MLQPQPTDQGIIETSHSGLRILKGGGMDHLRGETLRNSLGQVWWRRGDAHERWGILLPRLSQFPIPYVPGWMRVTSLISVHSALTPKFQEAGIHEASGQSHIPPFCLTRPLCLGSGQDRVCFSVFLSISEGKRVYIRIWMPKPVCKSPTVHVSLFTIASLLQSPVLTPAGQAVTLSQMREVQRIFSNVECMIQMHFHNVSDGCSVWKILVDHMNIHLPCSLW